MIAATLRVRSREGGHHIAAVEPGGAADPIRSWGELVVRTVSEDAAFLHCSVYRLAPGERVLRAIASAASSAPDRSIADSVCGLVHRTGAAALVADVVADAADTADEPEAGSTTRSKLAVPVRRGDRTLAVICVASPHVAAFGIRDLERLVAMARQLERSHPQIEDATSAEVANAREVVVRIEA